MLVILREKNKTFYIKTCMFQLIHVCTCISLVFQLMEFTVKFLQNVYTKIHAKFVPHWILQQEKMRLLK